VKLWLVSELSEGLSILGESYIYGQQSYDRH